MAEHETEDALERATLEVQREKLIEMRSLLIERRGVWYSEARSTENTAKYLGTHSHASLAARAAWEGAAGVSKQIAKLETKLARIERTLALMQDD